MSNPYVVEVDDVLKAFVTRHFFTLNDDTRRRQWYERKEVRAANHISFGIRRGEVFGLLGPNGAGKTTTVKMVSGLVRPDKGRVSVDGLDVERHRRKILEKVGVVLEGTRTSIWPLTPLENLQYYGNLKAVRGSILKDRSHDLLDFIGLKEKKNVQVRKLSRGQKQKLAICIALIADPQIILLDEPTTGLDVQSSRAIKDNIIRMTREQGKSVLVTTHDMHVAQELCDRIGIINEGKLVACKPTSELLDLFSDQVFEFKVDRFIRPEELEAVDGVLEVTVEALEDSPAIVVRVSPDLERRSQALYGMTAQFERLGLRLKSISHRQQNLETVFLQLTSNTAPKGVV